MQLRLVDGLPESESVRRETGKPQGSRRSAAASVKTTGTKAKAKAKTRRARTVKGGRATVHWADWHLDARTKRIGRAGVATARAALERADRPDPGTPLSEAS